MHEPANETGLTSLMTRASLKGTVRRNAQRIAEDAEFLGGVLPPPPRPMDSSGRSPCRAGDSTMRSSCSPTSCSGPSFPDDAVESERAVALANLAAMRDDMYRWPMRLATQAAWGSHPYGRSVLGTEQSLAAMDAEALRRWHREGRRWMRRA